MAPGGGVHAVVSRHTGDNGCWGCHHFASASQQQARPAAPSPTYKPGNPGSGPTEKAVISAKTWPLCAVKEVEGKLSLMAIPNGYLLLASVGSKLPLPSEACYSCLCQPCLPYSASEGCLLAICLALVCSGAASEAELSDTSMVSAGTRLHRQLSSEAPVSACALLTGAEPSFSQAGGGDGEGGKHPYLKGVRTEAVLLPHEDPWGKKGTNVGGALVQALHPSQLWLAVPVLLSSALVLCFQSLQVLTAALCSEKERWVMWGSQEHVLLPTHWNQTPWSRTLLSARGVCAPTASEGSLTFHLSLLVFCADAIPRD